MKKVITPRHLADRILQSKSTLEGECKQVTILLADVKSSMELAEQLGAEQWHAILERFFSEGPSTRRRSRPTAGR
ncbi:MAG: hypothetical protein GY725_09755 [bacterium]|nr:hypothetical protein [bacterium]